MPPFLGPFFSWFVASLVLCGARYFGLVFNLCFWFILCVLCFFCKHALSNILWNFDLILATIRILVLLLYVLEIWSYPSKHWSSGRPFFQLWNSDLILPNTGFLVLFLYTSVFRTSSSKLWNSGLSCIHIGFLMLSFKTVEFWPYFYKHWN